MPVAAAVDQLAPERALRGRMALRFAAEAGRTRLVAATRTPPWSVQRVLYLDRTRPALATATLLNGTAGLFAGDDLTLDLAVEAGAAAAVTTPAMTRAFAMPAGGGARLAQRLTVAADGYLEWLPEPLLLCADATVVTTTTVAVAAGGRAAFGETVAFGRVAHGDAHRYRRVTQRTELQHADRLVLADLLDCAPADDADAPLLVGRAAAMGTLYLLGDSGALDEVRALLAAQAGVWGGASLLPYEAGVAVRCLGHAPSAVQAALAALIARWRVLTLPAGGANLAST